MCLVYSKTVPAPTERKDRFGPRLEQIKMRILIVPKFTATLHCICLSIPQIYKQMQYRYW